MRKSIIMAALLVAACAGTGTTLTSQEELTAACEAYYRGLDTLVVYMDAGYLDAHDVKEVELSIPYVNGICLGDMTGDLTLSLETLRNELRELLLATSKVKE